MSHFPQGTARAWVSFDASSGTPSIGAALNATLTDDGVGRFTVNFTRAFANAHYVVAGTCRYDSSPSAAGASLGLRRNTTNAKTTTTCAIQTIYPSSAAYKDLPESNVVFVGVR